MNFDISWVLHMEILASGEVTDPQLYIGHSLCWPKSIRDWMRETYRKLLRFCPVVVTSTPRLQTMQSRSPVLSFVWKDLKDSRQSHATNYTGGWHSRSRHCNGSFYKRRKALWNPTIPRRDWRRKGDVLRCYIKVSFKYYPIIEPDLWAKSLHQGTISAYQCSPSWSCHNVKEDSA